MTAATATLGLLPILMKLQGTEIERPLAIVMTGGLNTSTLFTLFVLPTIYLFVHSLQWDRESSNDLATERHPS
jgi:heavy metal efflux system protein